MVDIDHHREAGGMSDNVIRFAVSVAQIKTMADGGLRFAFDAPETAIEAATELMRVKQAGGILEIAAIAIIKTPVNMEDKKNDKPRAKHFTPYAKQTKTEA